MRRRTLLLGLAASSVATATTRPIRSADGLFEGRRGRDRQPVLGRSLTLNRPHLFSRSNDNDRWALRVETGQVAPSRWVFAVTTGTTVALTVNNEGPTVGRIGGGRQRGVRNNRFHFQVSRGGVRLPELDGPDFGGPCGVQLLEPGQTRVAVEDIAKWASVDEPGTYSVRCTFWGELVPGTRSPGGRTPPTRPGTPSTSST